MERLGIGQARPVEDEAEREAGGERERPHRSASSSSEAAIALPMIAPIAAKLARCPSATPVRP